jgi:hypothetical protein
METWKNALDAAVSNEGGIKMSKIYVDVEDGWDDSEVLEIEVDIDDFEELSKEFFRTCRNKDLMGNFEDFLEKKNIRFKVLKTHSINLCIKRFWRGE